MTDSLNVMKAGEPQCQFFVVRKKRLCRMTVRPGRQYCGEHEPQPITAAGEEDTRIPCPNDPKHTCYISKLEKHLSICNARPTEQPPYIVHNINAPQDGEECQRLPLSQISKDLLLQVIDKVNYLYEEHVKDNISTLPERDIHRAVLPEFSGSDRTESSLRHLRQVSRLLHLTEDEGLVRDNTCYVELGAGKGQLSYYVCVSWCSDTSSAMLVDRASLRHKRDNKLHAAAHARRLRADLAHLRLAAVPQLEEVEHVVGLAKHLCGVATDLAIRCVTADQVLDKTLGIVLATCCHHRCEQRTYIANKHLKKLNISGEEFNVMLGIVSWATCGDGRSRDTRRNDNNGTDTDNGSDEVNKVDQLNEDDQVNGVNQNNENDQVNEVNGGDQVNERLVLSQEYREQVGRRAKQLIDWGRVLYLRKRGFDARLYYFVPTSVSLENVCIVAKKLS